MATKPQIGNVAKLVIFKYSTTKGVSPSFKPIYGTRNTVNQMRANMKIATKNEYLRVGLIKLLEDFFAPLRFAVSALTPEIKPIPKIINVIEIALAILIAPNVSVECLPATITSPMLIKVFPKKPTETGKESFISSL